MDGCPLGLGLVGEDKPTEFLYTFTANGTHFIAFWLSILHISGADPGVGNTGHIPPPLQAQQLPSCTSDLPFVQKMQQMHKISDDLTTILMISDERTMIFFALVSLLAIVRCRKWAWSIGCACALCII